MVFKKKNTVSNGNEPKTKVCYAQNLIMNSTNKKHLTIMENSDHFLTSKETANYISQSY